MTKFNAQKARTKYALPLWVDAFVRDTLDLSADEIGAFNLILWAMWTREACDMPDDDRKLSRVARATPQTWKRRIRPALEPFFEVDGEVWKSRRLLREAAKTEKFLAAQSARRTGADQENDPFTRHGGAQLENTKSDINSGNALKTNKQPPTTDNTTDSAPDRPTQETKRPSIGGGGSACVREADQDRQEPPPADNDQTPRERVLEAMGLGPDGVAGPSRFLGGQGDVAELGRWLELPGLTLEVVCEEVRRVAAAKADGPPSSFRYFTPAMQRLSAALSAPKLQPADAPTGQARASPVHLWKLDPDKFNDDGSIRE